jgi:3-hydroxyisobutyryl-CoA hydrolase
MPLRSKIPAGFGVTQSRSFTTNPQTDDTIDELPGDEADDVLFKSNYGVRSIQLNRPKKLNSLNGSMIRKIVPRLQEWKKSQLAQVIVAKGVGRAFCAGGDVKALATWNQQDPENKQRSKDYFALEYKLDHLIATYPKPYVVFMDGITMGGGVGLSIHAPFRIATENTVFAMPETKIGFFPDVGASFFLPRMDGNMGTYLAMTGEQLRGVDVFYHGIATHYINSTSLPDLEARLGELNFKDYSSLQDRQKLVNSTIEEFVSGLPQPTPSITGKQRILIDAVFDPESTVSEILMRLSIIKDKHPDVAAWAGKTIETLRQNSPTSVAVTLKQMDVGRAWDISQTFRREHSIASKFMEHPDFIEGVTEQLHKKAEQRKTRPDWKPSTLEEVEKAGVEDFFSGKDTLKLLGSNDGEQYKNYPHRWIGLPTEQQIIQKVQDGATDAGKILGDFVLQFDGKQGVKEKVIEVLERRAVVSDDGTISGMKGASV